MSKKALGPLDKFTTATGIPTKRVLLIWNEGVISEEEAKRVAEELKALGVGVVSCRVHDTHHTIPWEIREL